MDKKIYDECNKQRMVINKILEFMRDEGILSHLRHKRLKNDVRHWHLTKCGSLEDYRKRKQKLNKSRKVNSSNEVFSQPSDTDSQSHGKVKE